MLQINGLNLTHKKDLRIILDKFDLVLNYGDKAAIIGEEGNGKSTLMKWLYRPELVEDYIEAEGERILGNERLGYLPQEIPDIDKGKSLYEFFSENDCFWNQTPNELGEYAKRFGVPVEFFYSEQRIGTLSGGEKVKAQFMKILMQEPTVLLLDEPTRNFSPLSGPIIRKMIKEFPGSVISISHDRKYIAEVCDRVCELTTEGLK